MLRAISRSLLPALDGVLGTRTKTALQRFGASRGVRVEPPDYDRVRMVLYRECARLIEEALQERKLDL